jgi:hypothetical protein
LERRLARAFNGILKARVNLPIRVAILEEKVLAILVEKALVVQEVKVERGSQKGFKVTAIGAESLDIANETVQIRMRIWHRYEKAKVKVKVTPI